MADVLANVLAIAEFVIKARRYVKDVIDAEKDRKDFEQQVNSIASMTDSLPSWNSKTFAELNDGEKALYVGLRGPLAHIKKTLDQIGKTIEGEDSTWKQKLRNLKWQHDKKSVYADFAAINADLQSIIGQVSSASYGQLKGIGESVDGLYISMESQVDISRELLSRTSTGLSLTKETRDSVDTVLKMQKTTQEMMFEYSKEKKSTADKMEREKIQEWLSPLNFQNDQRETLNRATEVGACKTAQWFLEREAFHFWKEGKVRGLRCYGSPGAGKTMLTSVVVDHLTKSIPFPVLSIYLEKSMSKYHDTRSLMGALLKQLVQFNKIGITPNIKEAFEKADAVKIRPSTDELKGLLKHEIDSYDRVYAVIDGLDESLEESRDFVEQLMDSFPALSLLTTTRPDEEQEPTTIECNKCSKTDLLQYHSCESCYELYDRSFHLCMECMADQGHCDEDGTHALDMVIPKAIEVIIETPDAVIGLFVREAIEAKMPPKQSASDRSSARRRASALGKACRSDPALLDSIVSFIVQNARQRFLLASLYLRSLQSKNNLRDIEEAVEQMKKESYSIAKLIDKLYEEDLTKRLDGDSDSELARKVLSIVYFARRNLKLDELQHALATRAEDKRFKALGIIDAQDILKATQGFVRIDTGLNPIVRLDHLTLREYFGKNESRWFPSKGNELATICLTYLSFEAFSKPCLGERPMEEFETKEKEHPFISYAAQYWGDHVREASQEIKAHAVRYLDSQSHVDAYIQAAWAADTQDMDKWDIRRDVHPLHICAWFDLCDLMPFFNKSQDKLDVWEKTYKQTPLIYACRRGKQNAVRYLLEHGASINKQSTKGRTPLLETVHRINQEDLSTERLEETQAIFKLLTDAEVRGQELDVNATNPKSLGRTALMLLITKKQSDMALELLERTDIKINIRDTWGYTALALAAYRCLKEVVEAILALGGSDIDSPDSDGGHTPLIIAASSKYRESSRVINQLLANGADPDKTDKMKGTAALRAVEFENTPAVGMMITRHKVNVFAADEDSRGLLHWAAAKGNRRMVEILLENGLDVNLIDRFEMSPLHDACRCNRIEAAKILLERGAKVDRKDMYGRTPFDVARQGGHTKLMELCATHGYIPDEPLSPETLPIWSLARLGQLDLIRKRLSSDITALDEQEPLSKNTALHCALINQRGDADHLPIHFEIFQYILSLGTHHIDIADKFDRTALHLAAQYGMLKVTQELLRYDPSLDSIDRFGFSPLVIAFKNKNFYVAIALVEAGATIDKSRINIDKLLFPAIQMKNKYVVKRLLAEGADRMAQNEYGQTADQMAKQVGDGGETFKEILYNAKSFFVEAATTRRSSIISKVEVWTESPLMEIPEVM